MDLPVMSGAVDISRTAKIAATIGASVPTTNDPAEVPRSVGSLTIRGGGWAASGRSPRPAAGR